MMAQRRAAGTETKTEKLLMMKMRVEALMSMMPRLNIAYVARLCLAMWRTALSIEPSGPRSARPCPSTLLTVHACTAHSCRNMQAAVEMMKQSCRGKEQVVRRGGSRAAYTSGC